MIELLLLMFIVAILTGLGRWSTARRYRRKYEEKLKHNRYYNSLDPNSKYSERECCGTDCGCHTNEKKLTKGPNGTEENWSSGDM